DEKKKEPKRVGGVAVPFSVDRESSERHRVIPLESYHEYMNGTQVDISHGITYDIVSEAIGERVTGYEMVLSEHAHPENTAAIRLVFDDYNEVVGVDIAWNPRHKWLHFYKEKTKPILFTFLDSKGEKAKNFSELLALRRWIGGESEFFIHDEEHTLHINIREKDEEYPDGMVVKFLERLVGRESWYEMYSGYTEGRGKISWTGGANYPYNASLGEFQPVKVPGYDVDLSGQPLKIDLVEGALREIVDLFPNPGSQHFAMPNK
ncbi:MAG TPA: hypothetical protein VFQ63_04435, partial [Patescibacteria group bacterium]|nr:hypothetical protein [Patescibacteria group bacterium]